MRRLFAFLVFVVAVLLVIGFFRGWFGIIINQGQIKHDTHELRKEAEHGVEKAKEDLHQGAQKVEQKTSNTPTTP
ncbi:MAG TPA: hypothetical protein VHX65_08895 [Pirellulales bacterium]|nr:hypothetical protein [Pirellulales bacterium]